MQHTVTKPKTCSTNSDSSSRRSAKCAFKINIFYGNKRSKKLFGCRFDLTIIELRCCLTLYGCRHELMCWEII
ncbi:hypothetical protein NDU88_006074 [Pleurodeles waltl]|uniref:Uncharacterized protein n=1 Tax=Pleurodeles waltl TaxID=8319 RepID=A0AAV7ULS0_PLEWA|nr:hypothetical protein NDU88_006074 [Pleurodeles waltl]